MKFRVYSVGIGTVDYCATEAAAKRSVVRFSRKYTQETFAWEKINHDR